jgi:dTDP-4-amino-4,6-dideoxygalactose transaminase
MGINYGHPGDYDCRFVGLNGRMSEVHAAIALDSLRDLDARIAERNEIAAAYREALERIPGIRFAETDLGDLTTYKDLRS